ncbi:MAG: CHASE domain-containing protein [Nitrospirae bacterium]|nr:CHASE domain-containing protein [Nitrospirota bacterium]
MTRAISKLWIILLTLLSAAIAVAVYYAAAFSEDAAISAQFKRIFDKQTVMIQRDLDDDFEIVIYLGRLFHSIENINGKEFSSYIMKAPEEHPSVYAFEWVPRVSYSQKTRYELTAREEGVLPDFYIFEKAGDKNIPVAARDEYFPIYYVEPKEQNAAAIGFDIASTPMRRRAIEKARDTGELTASEPVILVQERESGVRAFLVFMPVYYGQPKTLEERRHGLKGFTSGVFRVNDILQKSFCVKGYLNEHAVFDIEDEGLSAEERLLYHHGPTDARELSKLSYIQQKIDVAGRTLQLRAAPVKAYFQTRRTWGPFTFAAGSFIIIILLASYYKTTSARTSQIKAEVLERTRELEASETRMRAIIDGAVNSIIIIDHVGTVQLFNIAAEKTFGYGAAEVMGHNIKMLMPEPHSSAHDQYLLNYITTGNKKVIGMGREVSALRKDGTTFPMYLSVSEIKSDNQKKIFVGLCVDISKRKEAEKELTRLSERLSLAVRSGGLGIWDLDLKTGKLIWNEQMFGLYDVLPENFKGTPSDWSDRLHPDDLPAAQAKLNAALRGEKDLDTEFRIITSTGEKTIRASLITQRDASDQAIRMIGVNWDITAERKREKELLDLSEGMKAVKDMAEKASNAKSEFLSSMSHEIRTPLNAIIGMADLLSETNLTEEQAKYIDTFRHAGDSLLVIINDILDLSKVEAGLLELESMCFELNELLAKIGEIMSFHAHSKGLELVITQFPETIGLIGDAMRLRQVIVNLVGNAIKFTEKGEIAVMAEVLSKTSSDMELKFSVRDTGIGIPNDKLASVFERFTQVDSSTTRKYGGTGLGLTISKRFVEMMGGQIFAESEYGKGSVFSFTAKFKVDNECRYDLKPADNQRKETPPPGKIETRPLSILLVEDNEDNRNLILMYLKKTGHKVETAENGQIAVEKFISGHYDLVLMDMEMPVKDGLTAVRELRQWEEEQKKQSTTIVALTAHALREHEEKCREAGCDGYLTKPIKKAALLDALAKYGG